MRLVKVLVQDERKCVKCLFHGWVIKDGEESVSGTFGYGVKPIKTDKYYALIEDNKGVLHEVDRKEITFVNHYSEVLKK